MKRLKADENGIVREKCEKREEEIRFGTWFLWRQGGEKEESKS